MRKSDPRMVVVLILALILAGLRFGVRTNTSASTAEEDKSAQVEHLDGIRPYACDIDRGGSQEARHSDRRSP